MAGAVPEGVTTRFQGEAAAFQDSLGNLGLLLIMAVLVIYLVLGVLYESFIHPLTILSGLPAAGVGALATLMLFGEDLSVYGFVGILMLIGIVKKNAIMMIDFALEAERNHGKPPAESIVEACLVRFRPIMMTTFAALMGALPIALGIGAGAESRRPLGLAVVGGLALLATADALHHAGDLPLYGQAAETLGRTHKVRPPRQSGKTPGSGRSGVAVPPITELSMQWAYRGHPSRGGRPHAGSQ